MRQRLVETALLHEKRFLSLSKLQKSHARPALYGHIPVILSESLRVNVKSKHGVQILAQDQVQGFISHASSRPTWRVNQD